MKLASPVLILGARSDIGRMLARRYAEAGCDVILAARRAGELDDDRADIALRYGVQATTVEFDVLSADPDTFFTALDVVPGTVVMVAGLLGDQAAAMDDPDHADQVMRTNFNGPALFLLAVARRMAPRGSGTIIGISSVAGDRGRGSNFVYGSAKAGFTAFLSGLRNSMTPKGVAVMTVKPGFVATQMTAGMPLPAVLTASADEIASAIVRAQRAGKDVVYWRWIWWPIMTIIKMIPEPIFKKLKL